MFELMYLCYIYVVIYICGLFFVCKLWKISNNKKKIFRIICILEKNSYKIFGIENYNFYICVLRVFFINIFVKN